MDDIEIFKKYLLEGNLMGVRNSLQQSFLEINVDVKNKRKPIHLASRWGHLEIAQLLIEQDVNIECKDKYGMIPIHLACRAGHLEIVQLLTVHQYQLNCKTPEGLTPMDLSKKNGHVKCVKLIQEIINNKKIFDCVRCNDEAKLDKLYEPQILFIQEYNTRLSLLQVAVQTNADKIIKYLLDRKVNDEELSDLPNGLSRLMQEFMLYRCIKQYHYKGFELLCSADTINGQHGIIKSSFLELTASHGSMMFVYEILKKSLYDKDIWQKAKTIANEKGHCQIVKMISEREYVLNLREKFHLTILHTAVCDNDPDMVHYILDNHLVNPDANNEVFGTALALAYLFCHRRCVQILEQFKVNPNTCNKYSQSPLHEAIVSGMIDNCEYLVDRSENIDLPGFMGFTALHDAVMRGYPELCLQLVKKGADCNRYIQLPRKFVLDATKTREHFTERETPGTLCIKTHGTLYPCIMDNLDGVSVNSCDDNNNSLLHLSVQCMQLDICKQLIDAGSMIDPINDKGNSPLLELLSMDCQAIRDNIDEAIAIVQLLIESGADINKTTINGSTVFQCATEYRDERLMVAVMSNQFNFSVEDFKLVFNEKWYNCAEIMISRLDKHFLLSNITSEIFDLVMIDVPSILMKLMFENAEIAVQKLVIENMLYKSVMENDDGIFDYLIRKDIGFPKLFENGETLLTLLLKKNKTKYCDKLLRSSNDKNFVNLRNALGQTPLQVALQMDLFDIADNLVCDCNDLNNEDNSGSTALVHLLALISNTDDPNVESKLLASIKSIISQGGDIYKVTSNGHQVINSCTNQLIRSTIERFTERKQRGATVSVVERIVEVEKKICIICSDREVDCALNCGHTFCMQCGEEFVRCPVCNADSTKFRRIFLN